MKHTKKTLGTMLLSVAVLTSCADMDPLGFNAFEKPASIEGMEYLADYDALKEYKSANSSVSPDFKLGMALSANDYNANGMWTRLANANFDEVVAGNEMKMASIVDGQGKMDFGTVSAFVTNAETNGMNIYGHTLAWHSQQPLKWLRSLIADRIPEGEGDEDIYACNLDFEDGSVMNGWGLSSSRTNKEGSHDGSKYMEISNPTTGASWQAQAAIDFNEPLEEGKSYTLHFWAKSSSPYSMSCGLQDPSTYSGGGNFANAALTEEWQEFTSNATVSGGSNIKRFLFSFGDFEGTIDIDDVSIYSASAPKVKIPVQVAYYPFDDGVNVMGWGNGSTHEIVEGGPDGGKCLLVNNPSSVNPWEAQIAMDFSEALEIGTTFYLHFWAKADTEGSVNAAFQNPENYSGCGDYPNFTMTNEWKEYTLSTVINGQNCKRLCYNLGSHAGKMYFDDIEVYYEIDSSTIPLTPEEKKDTLTWAMEQWVAGMMDACGGKVKAWDVVNEAISGGDPDAEGVFALQHDLDGAKPNDFYWQDYLGDLDYVRTVVKFARQYGPEDIKLFVNDYNLESDWDNNQKLKSLIAWIKRWEADGVTKIDGIGTQMHLAYYSNPETQASKEKHIVEMFKLMAASGKLVRVSELDIEFKDEQGNNVVVENMTDAQLRKVSDFYKWIIQQYIANVPAAQQYGFCIWTAVDADPSTSWTHNQLYGLWDKNFNRTHAYAGFADGLGGE